MTRYLGIDYGSKKIGLALSDEEGKFAFPHGVYKNDRQFIESLVTLINKEAVHTAVVGESLTYEGRENEIMQSVKNFVATLQKRIPSLSITLQDERYTSAHAGRQFETKEKTRKQIVKKDLDASAAALILQSYLDTTN